MSFSRLKKILEQAKNMRGGKLETQFQGKVYCPAPDKPNPDRCMLTVADEIGELIADKNSVYLEGRQKENQKEQFKFTPETKAMYCSKKGERGRCWLIVNKLEEEPLLELREELKEELEKLRGREIVDPEKQKEEEEEELEFNKPESGTGEAMRWGKKPEPKAKPEPKVVKEEIKKGIKIERSETGKKLDDALEQYLKNYEESKKMNEKYTEAVVSSLNKKSPAYQNSLSALNKKFKEATNNEDFLIHLQSQEYELLGKPVNGEEYFRKVIGMLMKDNNEDQEALTETVQQFSDEFKDYVRRISVPEVPSQIKRKKSKSKKSRIEQIKKQLKK